MVFWEATVSTKKRNRAFRKRNFLYKNAIFELYLGCATRQDLDNKIITTTTAPSCSRLVRDSFSANRKKVKKTHYSNEFQTREEEKKQNLYY